MSKRPLRWLDEASPEEIGEALLAVGPEKAVRVGVYLATRLGPEFAVRIDRAVEQAEANPADAVGRTLAAGFKAFLGG